jgi:ABC-type transport system substrate-binding protein
MKSIRIAGFVAALVTAGLLAGTGVRAGAQKVTPADLAARLSGTWAFNAEKSPAVRQSERRLRGGAPLLAVAPTPSVIQRGRGRGGGRSSANAGLAYLQQLAARITITATPESVTIEDPRGARTYAIDNKNAKIEVAGSELTAKTRWDKETLRQEFLSGELKLTHVWETSADGKEMTLHMRLEDYSQSMPSRGEVKVVYDRES